MVEVWLALLWACCPCNNAPSTEIPGGAPPTTRTSGRPKVGCAWRLRGAFQERLLLQFEQLIAKVEKHGPPHFVGAYRNFGQGEMNQGGQSVTYLHHFATKALVDELWAVAARASIAMDWNILPARGSKSTGDGTGQNKKAKTTLRCLEAIDYLSIGEQAAATTDQLSKNGSSTNHSIGWHSDGHTLLTISVMLSSRGQDFDGGSFEMKGDCKEDGNTVSAVVADRGDAVVWRGWDMHRVSPVTRGVRRVIVAELWSGKAADSVKPRWDDTHTGFKHALRLDPRSARLHIDYGALFVSNGDKASALKHFQKALKIAPQESEVHQRLGKAHLALGDMESALVEFQAAFKTDPQDVEVCNNLGTVHEEQGNPRKAISSYHLALDIDPMHANARFNLGRAYEQLGNMEQAADSYLGVLEIAPADAGAHYNLGLVRWRKGQLHEARSSYKAAIQLAPQDADAHANLAMISGQLGDRRQSARSYKVALRLNPLDHVAREGLARALATKEL